MAEPAAKISPVSVRMTRAWTSVLWFSRSFKDPVTTTSTPSIFPNFWALTESMAPDISNLISASIFSN